MILRQFSNDPERKLPSLLVTAGVHGDEFGAMRLLDVLSEAFESSGLEMNAAFANYCNPPAVRNASREGKGVDSSDLNRGWRRESARSRLEELVVRFDVLLDLHCSHLSSEFLLFNNGQNVSYEWLEDQGIPFAVREGSDDTLKMFADRELRLGMTWEMKGIKVPDERAVIKSADIIFGKILSRWGEFTKNAYGTDEETRKLMPEHLMQPVIPRTEGIIRWRLADAGMGERVSAGEELGKIVCIDDGSVSEKLFSPCAGTIMCAGTSYARPYQPVCFVQPRLKANST